MELLYHSTRGEKRTCTASQTILKGLAGDGGLFVPERIPLLDKSLAELSAMDYRQTAYEVMKLYFTDYTEEELHSCINRAYDEKFDCREIAPVVKKKDAYYLELFHGATIAFKDMALSILPHLMVTAAEKNGCEKEIVILTATSGDTGKAALAGFADVPGTRIAVFYPKGGVSPVQERQMVTQKGENVKVIGLRGNFDDAQTGVKELFTDRDFEKQADRAGFQFSSANSINIGRLIPQIVYYVYAYTRLVAEGELSERELLNVAVPTGNFGNILAAFYAKQMGLPLGKLICASNENRVLYDFFRTGCYDRNREFILTSSPSMDILVSSNLERLLYRIVGEDAKENARMMRELKEKGAYRIGEQSKEQLKDFYGNYASQAETAARIRETFEEERYVLDPHTAVAAAVYEKYRKETSDPAKTLIVSTASPYKFVRSVMSAICPEKKETEDFALIDGLEELSGIPQPKAIREIRNADIRHSLVVDRGEMKAAVADFLGMPDR